jgi:uncharacterized membrane protein affecting hemolysin expression
MELFLLIFYILFRYEYQFDEKLPISENGELQKLDNNLIEQTQQRAEELMRKDMEQFAQCL